MNAQTVTPYFVTHRDKTLSVLGEFIAIDALNGLDQPTAFVGVREGKAWADDGINLPAAPATFNSEKSVCVRSAAVLA